MSAAATCRPTGLGPVRSLKLVVPVFRQGLVSIILVICSSALGPHAAAWAGSRLPVCDPPAYAGVWRCTWQANDAVVSVVIVDLRDARVRLGMALPGRMQGSVFVECNSVNHSGRDRSSNCLGDRYPLERIPTMLQRYRRRGAVAAINTDYFGFPDASHGAKGLAIRAGERLDGPAHNPGSGIPFIRSYMAIARDNPVTFGKLIFGAARFDLAGEFFTSVGGGPILAQRGRVWADEPACLAEQLAPEVCTRRYQTAAGLTPGGDYLVLATGRHTTGSQLAEILVEDFGAWTVIKFDGGGSAQMAWLDYAGQVRGFDAEIEVDDGFRYVAQGLLVFSSALEGDREARRTGLDVVKSVTEFEQPPGAASGQLCRPALCSD